MTSIIWFREDLRVTDNPAFYYACKHTHVIAIYIISHQAWAKHAIADCRKIFLFRQLQQLSQDLQKLNIALQIIEQDGDTTIPVTILQFMQTHSATELYFNEQYEFDEQQRDGNVTAELQKNNYSVHRYHDQLIFSPGSIRTASGQYYKIFTPFKQAWLRRFHQELPLDTLPIPSKRKVIEGLLPTSLNAYLPQKFIDANQYWEVGELHAKEILDNFIENSLDLYQQQRDFPALDASSKLSPYLAAGIISSRYCLATVLRGDPLRNLAKTGIATWVNELIWREFYKSIIFLFPHICKNKPFKVINDHLLWQDNRADFSAWCQGKTGYPLIDAAMRQLLQLGWMHNRLRMLVAMFLTKDLLIDWRKGEEFFMRHLIDGDFAANNGGWQWSAGTGVDAAPYFRIFNPITQSEKFDKQGNFIRQYCPELVVLDNRSIHFPTQEQRRACHYPDPIVDHKIARELFLQKYKTV